ncbi:hypothetical protein ACVNYA_004281, partial [Escherichia coli]
MSNKHKHAGHIIIIKGHSFKSNENGMWNLTEIWKILGLPNNKLPSQWRGMNRPGFPGEYFICELRLPDHYFRWKHNKLFLLLPEEYGPA